MNVTPFDCIDKEVLNLVLVHKLDPLLIQFDPTNLELAYKNLTAIKAPPNSKITGLYLSLMILFYNKFSATIQAGMEASQEGVSPSSVSAHCESYNVGDCAYGQSILFATLNRNVAPASVNSFKDADDFRLKYFFIEFWLKWLDMANVYHIFTFRAVLDTLTDSFKQVLATKDAKAILNAGDLILSSLLEIPKILVKVNNFYLYELLAGVYGQCKEFMSQPSNNIRLETCNIILRRFTSKHLNRFRIHTREYLGDYDKAKMMAHMNNSLMFAFAVVTNSVVQLHDKNALVCTFLSDKHPTIQLINSYFDLFYNETDAEYVNGFLQFFMLVIDLYAQGNSLYSYRKLIIKTLSCIIENFFPTFLGGNMKMIASESDRQKILESIQTIVLNLKTDYYKTANDELIFLKLLLMLYKNSGNYNTLIRGDYLSNFCVFDENKESLLALFTD